MLLLTGVAGCGSAAEPPPTSGPTPSVVPTGLPSPTDRSPHGVLLSAQLAMTAARRAEFSYRLGAEQAVGVLFWAPKTVLTVKYPDTAEQLIVLDTTAYRGGDPATAERTGGRHWEKFTAPGGQREIPYAGLVDRINPMVALTAAVAAESPRLIGEEELGEATVQHYRLTVGVDRYVAAQTLLPAGRQQALQAALSAGGAHQLTLDLWLNDKDQLVQLRRSSEGGPDDTMTYKNLGGPLSVQAPAESDTVDEGARTLPPLAS
ncbi:lipoprotein [Kitasatospora sp. CMC57]